MMGAWFKRNVSCRAFRLTASHLDSLCFRMGSTASLRIPAPDNNAFGGLVKLNDHAANSRVRRDLSKPPRRKAKRVFHVAMMYVGIHKESLCLSTQSWQPVIY